MDAIIGRLSLLKDKKPSDSFVLVVQLITLLYGASRQLVFISATHFGKRCVFPSLPSSPLPSLTLPYSTPTSLLAGWHTSN